MKILKIISVIRSLVVCMKVFGIRGGYKCPVLISNDVKIRGIYKGSISLDNKRFGVVKIGFNKVEGVSSKKGFLIIENSGKMIFHGSARIGAGTSIRIDGGELEIGHNFTCNNNCFISCSKGIKIGDNCLFGWCVNIRDADGHSIKSNGENQIGEKKVSIGNNVWISACADILKGVSIADGSVVGYRSLVTRSFSKENVLIAGFPADIIKENISWEK